MKKLEAYSKQFLDLKEREKLLDSLEKDKTQWLTWGESLKAVLGNLSSKDKLKFSALLVLVETNPKSGLFHDRMKEFLIARVQFWKHHDFKKEGGKLGRKETVLWVDRLFKLFTSKSFIRLLIIILIIAFIVWFYVDRAAYLEFIKSIIKSFFQAIR